MKNGGLGSCCGRFLREGFLGVASNEMVQWVG